LGRAAALPVYQFKLVAPPPSRLYQDVPAAKNRMEYDSEKVRWWGIPSYACQANRGVHDLAGEE
jgi:hypothetical protein